MSDPDGQDDAAAASDAVTGTKRAVSEADVRNILNKAADDVLAAAGEPETGIRDAINLVVNATLHRLFDDRGASLSEVVTANYCSEGEDGLVTLSEVVQWMISG